MFNQPEKLLDRMIISNKGWGVVLLAALVATLLVANPGADPDLFARLAMGKLIATQGHVPFFDPFSFAPKNPIWFDHEWLAGVVFYSVRKAFGEWGLVFLAVAFSCYTMVWLARSSRIMGQRDGWALTALTIAMVESLYLWTSIIRAQVFTYLFLSIYVYALLEYRYKSRLRLVLLLPAILIAWTNAHGGFVLGLMVLALFALIETLTSIWPRSFEKFGMGSGKGAKAIVLGVILIICCLCTLVNPYGIAYLDYVLTALNHPRTSITEFAATNFFTLGGCVYYLLGLACFIAVLVVGRKPKAELVILLLGGFILGALYVRLQALFYFSFAISAGTLLSQIASMLFGRYSHLELPLARVAKTYLLIALVVCAAYILAVKDWSYKSVLNYKFFPRSTLQCLQTHSKGGRLLVDFNRGSYALWTLYPKFSVSIDGRYEEVYPESTMQLNSLALDFENARSQTSFNILNPTHILVDLPQLTNLPPWLNNWKIACTSESFAILSKEEESLPEAVSELLKQ